VSVFKVLQTLLSTLLKRTNGVIPSGGLGKPSAISMSFSSAASLFAYNHSNNAVTQNNCSELITKIQLQRSSLVNTNINVYYRNFCGPQSVTIVYCQTCDDITE